MKCDLFREDKKYYRDDLEPEREEAGDYEFTEEYNLIVIGTEPEGIAAAVSGARNGLKTLLIDGREEIGGLMVRGMLNTLDMNYDPDGELVTRGIFAEFYDRLEGTSFNTETAEQVFRDMIAAEDNLELKTSSEIKEPLMEGDKVIGLEARPDGEDDKSVFYAGERLIDATVDADFAVAAGAPYSVGMKEITGEEEYQVATLIFELKNVDWQRAKNYLSDDGNSHTGGDNRSLWGFSEEMKDYESIDPGIDVRGLNVGRQEGDRVLINSLHVFGVDPLDEASVKDGRARAAIELPEIEEYLNENVVGFENAELSKFADELYLREGRHIKAKKTLTINDVRENRNFSDKIALASYPVDIQRTARDNQGFVYNNPALYSIPFGALVPREVENLLVVGKAAGFDPLAHGSARVIPVGMTTAQAAGAAARLSLEKGVTFGELEDNSEVIGLLQERLKEQGVYLQDFDYPFAGEGRWTLDGIRFINSLGLLVGGYENDFGFEERMTGEEFRVNYIMMLKRHFKTEKVNPGNRINEIESEYVTPEDVARTLLETAGDSGDGRNPVSLLREKGMISAATASRLEGKEYLQKDVVYVIFREFASWAEEENLFQTGG